MKHFRVYWQTCILLTLLMASIASATTIVMPTDEQLVAKSPVIVEGDVLSTLPIDVNGRIWTETVVSVSSVIKGSNVGATVTIREIGGVIDNRITKIFGAPEYAPGEHVLLFLTPTSRGDYQTVDLFVGKFTEEKTLDGRRLWARHDEAADVTLLDRGFQPIEAKNVQRAATGFRKFVEERVAGRKGAQNYGVENPVIERDSARVPAGGATDYFTLISEPTVYRWSTFDNGGSVAWYAYGTQPGYSGGGLTEVQTAMNVWTGYASAKIHYTYAGTETTAAGMDSSNGRNEVLFNDPFGDISGSWNPSTGGVVGLGGFNGVSGTSKWTATFTADSSHAAGTYTAYSISEANLTIQDGVSSSTGIKSQTLAEICAHEFGHTLGFGHSADNNALMYANVTGLGPSLRADDQLAAQWLYPNGSATPPPSTTTAPPAPSGLSASINAANNVVLRWTDNASNETGESIYYATSGGAFQKAVDVAAGTTQATLTGFAAGTSYSFYVVAYNSAGQSSASNTASVTFPSSTAVQAAFTVNFAAGIAGQTNFAFSDQSSGSVTSRLWQFGDGATSTAANPTHVYGAAGTYTVVLTVSGGGTQSSATRSIGVTASQPALVPAFAFAPTNPTTQQNVTFVDQSTGGVTSWGWDFGDGSTSAQQNPVKNYQVAGAYTVTLTIYRNAQVASTSKVLIVANAVPAIPAVSASFDFSPASPKAADSVSFSDRSSGGPGSWTWSFGDGSSSSAQNPVHAYAVAGTYNVSLTVANAVSSSTTSKVITVAPNVQTYRTLVSVAAQTNGVGGSVWRTELTIFNGSSEAVSASLTFIPGAAGAMQNRSLFLAPKQAVTYANALLDIFGMASGAGAVAIEATSNTSMPLLKISSRTFTDGLAGTYGQAVPDVTDLSPTLYLTGLASNAAFRTNVGLVNRSATTATATLTLVDGNGGVAGYTNVSVPPNSFQQSPLATYFPTIGSRTYDALSMTVTTTAANSVSVYASVVDNRTQDPVYVQGTASVAGNLMMIPAVGRAPGANGTFWRSDVTIYNPGTAPLGVGLRFLAAGADNRSAAMRSVGLAPGQTIVLADILASFGLESGNGALELSWSSATAPVVASRTYTTAAGGGTYGQSIEPVSRFSRDQYVPGLRSDGSFRTNIGFVNNGDVAAGISLSLISATGQTLATGFVAVQPKSQQQASLSALFPGVNTANLGAFTLQAHTDTGATIAVYGSIVDNTSGDPVYFAGE